MTFGERLRRERVSAGLTQRGLGSVAGVRQSTVCGIEQGRRGLTMDMARRLSAAVGVDVADLLLDGQNLFEVEFAVGPLERSTPPPWLERQLLAQVPDHARRRVAVWPYRGDGVLRLRARASSLPVMAALTGTHVAGISDSLPAPVVRPVRESESLTVLIRATSMSDAHGDLDRRLQAAECTPRVKIEQWAGLWRAQLKRVPRAASLALQGLVETSPIGLFVPA